MNSFTNHIINFYNSDMSEVVDAILPEDCMSDSQLIRHIASMVPSLIRKHHAITLIYEDEKRWPLYIDEDSGFKEVKEGKPLGAQYQLILQWLIRSQIISEITELMLQDSANVYLVVMDVDDMGYELDVRINHVNQSYLASLLNPYARKISLLVNHIASDYEHKIFMTTLSFDIKMFKTYETLKNYVLNELGQIRIPCPEDNRKFEEDVHPVIKSLNYPVWFRPTSGELTFLPPNTHSKRKSVLKPKKENAQEQKGE